MIPTTSDINNFVRGNINYITQNRLPKHQQEQIRLREFLCQDCLSNGKCTECGCKTPNMFYAPSKTDSKKKWGEFMSEVQWTALVNNIDLYAKFIEILRSESGGSTSSSSDSSTINQDNEQENISL